MGLESYFVHLLPEGVVWLGSKSMGDSGFKGHSPVRASLIINSIKSTLGAKSVPIISGGSATDPQKLVVENAIEVWVDDEGGYFQKATLVGCFAWYDEGLRICYQIACLIAQHASVRLFQQSVGFRPLQDEEDFVRTVRQIHRDKHKAFLEAFGDVRARLLPNKDFYDYYSSLGHPLRRLVYSMKLAWRR